MKTKLEKQKKSLKGMSISALAEKWEVDRRTMATAIKKGNLSPLDHDPQGNPRYDDEEACSALNRFFPLPPMTPKEAAESMRCLTLNLLYSTEYMAENPGCSREDALIAGIERRIREEDGIVPAASASNGSR
jgi:hypothetical protein